MVASEKMRKSIVHIIIFFLISLVFTIILGLFQANVDDTAAHISRIYNLAQSFKNGNIDPFMYESCFCNLGYPYGIFYPDTFLKPFALCVYFGMHEYLAYLFMIFCINFFTFLVPYFCIQLAGKQNAFIVSLCYFIFPYRIYDLIIRGAVGELLFFVFFPVLLLGLYFIFYKKQFSWCLSLGLLGILNSHILSTILTLMFLIVFYLVNIKKCVKTPRILLHTLINAVFTLLCSLKIIVPILEAQLTEDLLYIANPSFLGKTMANTIQLSPAIAICILVGIILILTVLIIKKAQSQYIKHFLLLCLLLIATTNLCPWNLLEQIIPFVSIIQFPTRLLMLAILPAVFLTYKIITKLKIQKYFLIIVYILTTLLSVYTCSTLGPKYESSQILYNGCGQFDYLNVDFEKLLTSNDYNIDNTLKTADDNLKIDLENTNEYITTNGYIPKIFYLNYQIVDENNVCYEYENKHGLIFIPALQNLDTKIFISYSSTLLQKTSTIISNISFIIFVGYLFWQYYNKKYR